ncbi:MAG TPA: tetratricopeptide repeat protein, partial [Gammaproteobacteria bacterium]|nr:tetratricopeptide repeat protein [Gammaproteobacteria bacterium]
MRAANPGVKSQEAHLLYARTLEALGETDKALKEYAAVCRYFSGLEANCRYALLLKQQGRQAEARELFEDIIQVTKHTTHHSRRLNREWIAIAKRELAR